MNWNSTEFIWLDWLVLTVGVIATCGLFTVQ